MRPYPAYKATGTTWLGEVPAHWDVKMLKHLGRFKAGAGFPIEHQEVLGEEFPFFKVKDIGASTDRCWMTESGSTVSLEIAKNLGANIFPKETIVFAKVGAALLLNRFRMLGLSSCIDNNMMGFSITEDSVLPRFMWSAMQRINFREFANPGPVPSLNETQVSNLYFALPSYGEQQAIAAYLDRETARIDTLIAEKVRLIETLREYRQATISEVVTQGLDPAAPKKPSGVPWLGDVPAHWDIKMLKYLGRFKAGAGFPIEHQGVLGEEYPFFKVKDIEASSDSCWMTESDNTVSIEIAKNLGANIFPKETIVFAKVGAALLLNRFRMLGLSSCIDNNMMGFSITEESVLPRFMWSAMQRINFREFANPGPVPSLNETQISNLYFALPSYGEQQTIAAYLDRETARIDKLLEHVRDEIKLLQELRAATITDAVTGKIQVSQQSKITKKKDKV